MEHKFEILYNGKKIQSGSIEADTKKEAYRKFLKLIYEKEFGEIKTYRGEPATDSDIFQSFKSIFK
jgi:hypothetical protein